MTMLDKLLQIIAPHYCCGCRQPGSLLCDSCIYDIIDEQVSLCLRCGTSSLEGVCSTCRQLAPYQKTWCVTVREGSVEELINRYKFTYAKAAHRPLARLLDQVLPVLPKDTVIIPVPTIGKHIRQRGYDQVLVLAKALAKQRNLTCQAALRRRNSAVQREAINTQQRQQQAAEAFRCVKQLDKTVPYLIVDDVVTTGATVWSAAECLEQAGAKQIFIAAIARNPLDSSRDL